MGNIAENAKAYEPKTTKNISELEKVPCYAEVKTKEVPATKDTEAFEYDYIEHDGDEYRLPKSVLRDLKVILEDNPTLTFFKVKKTGNGMDTKYTVIPLND